MPSCRETQRGRRFARGPHVHEAMQNVLFRLQPQFETLATRCARVSSETVTLVPNDRLDRRQQFSGRHHAHGHACAREHGLQNLVMTIVRNDNAVHDAIPTDDA